MPYYRAAVTQAIKMLGNLDRWLDKAVEYAEKHEMNVDDFVQFRLAPAMYPLAGQVQAACDGAKFTAARLSGTEAPSHPDEEKTIAELKARVASTVEYLGSLTEDQFIDADSRQITLAFIPGKGATGSDYFHEMAHPNFYFHVVSAYAILRHNGVDVGKRDFIGSVTLHDLESE